MQYIAMCVSQIIAVFSIARCLGAKRVSQRSFEWLSQHPILTHTVTDRQAVSACINIAGLCVCVVM